MNIGGDISQNKCDRCDSFLVWNEFGDSRSDESRLEEVCEECESSCTDCGTFKNSDEIYGGMYLFDKDSTDGEITPKLYSSDDFYVCHVLIKKKNKRYKMKVTLSNWDISMAIFDYLEKHYGLSNESYFDGLEMFIEKQSKNLIDEDYIKREFEKDQVWKEDKLKTLKEYELEGVYIKRKKKGAKKYTYIKLEKKHMQDIINLTDEDISFYIESEY